jgi:hypothetical protein
MNWAAEDGRRSAGQSWAAALPNPTGRSQRMNRTAEDGRCGVEELEPEEP